MKKIYENVNFEIFEVNEQEIVAKFKGNGATLHLIRGGLGIDLKTDGQIIRHPIDPKAKELGLVLPAK